MKKVIIIFSILFLQATFYSCKKETIITLTQADEVTTELQKVLSGGVIKRIIAWSDRTGFPPSISPATGTDWSFPNGFITIRDYNRAFNLLYLDSYEIANVQVTDGTQPTALILHFKD